MVARRTKRTTTETFRRFPQQIQLIAKTKDSFAEWTVEFCQRLLVMGGLADRGSREPQHQFGLLSGS